MNKVINLHKPQLKTMTDWCKKFAKDYEVYTDSFITNMEIPNLERNLSVWNDYKFEFPYINFREGKKLGAFEIVSSQIIGLHLHFSIRSLREYEDILNHIKNFDFHDFAISLRKLIELSMMSFFVAHRLEKAIKSKEIKTILSIVFRTAYATQDKIINPNDLTRFFSNKIENLGLKKNKKFHINDTFDYFWKNETSIDIEILDEKGKSISKDVEMIGGKNKSEEEKQNFQEFYNFLSEEVHPVGILSRLPYRENFYDEDVNKGISEYFKDMKLDAWTFGSSDKNYKVFWFSFYLFRNVFNYQSSYICQKLFQVHNEFNEFDVKDFDNTVKNLLGEKLELDCNEKISEEFMNEELERIKQEYDFNESK